MKHIIVLLVLLLAGCATYSDVHTESNAVEVHYAADFETAYQRIVAGMTGYCGAPPQTVVSNIYPNNQTATITQVAGNLVYFTMDLKPGEAGGTDAKYFPGSKATLKWLPYFKGWVDEGKADCKSA